MLAAIVEDLRAVTDLQIVTIASDDEYAFRQAAASAAETLVIAPETDGILETRCRWVEEERGCLLGPCSTAIRLTGDKLTLFKHFNRIGISTPRTWPIDEAPRDLFPVVWKPRDGAGSQATYLVRSATEKENALKKLKNERPAPAMIAQEFVEGKAASVAFLMGPLEGIALQPCRQHLSDDGRFHYRGGSCPIEPDLAERVVAVAAPALRAVEGLRGYVGVDVVIASRPADDRVIEINPRLTTSYIGLRRLAKFNIAATMRCIARGEPHEPIVWRSGHIDFGVVG